MQNVKLKKKNGRGRVEGGRAAREDIGPPPIQTAAQWPGLLSNPQPFARLCQAVQACARPPGGRGSGPASLQAMSAQVSLCQVIF